MGEGNRHDTLDDRIDYHNYDKNIGHGTYSHQTYIINKTQEYLGPTLSRRLKAAIEEQSKQSASFEFANKLLGPEKRAKWLSVVNAWKMDRSQPNPYLLPDACKAFLYPRRIQYLTFS